MRLFSDERKKLRTGRICVGGYFFHTCYIKGNKRYLRCCKSKQLGCRSRAVLPLGLPPSKTVVFRGHNHPHDKNEKDTSEFLDQLKLACRSGIDLSIKNIYDSVAKMYVGSVAKIFPDGAKLKSFHSVRSSMERWRRQQEDI